MLGHKCLGTSAWAQSGTVVHEMTIEIPASSKKQEKFNTSYQFASPNLDGQFFFRIKITAGVIKDAVIKLNSKKLKDIDPIDKQSSLLHAT